MSKSWVTSPPHLALGLALSLSAAAAWASDTPAPASVGIPGDFQAELGCSGDWQPECPLTHLTLDAEDLVWQGTFEVPAGTWEYKAALNDSWTENYGQNATRNGANLVLSHGASGPVKFYYDHRTHWVADNASHVIATAPGDYQTHLGCAGNWDPACLRAWLQDPDGDGVYTFTTRAIPAGSYEVKVAVGESWSENYGQGGVANGANIPFTVPHDCAQMQFRYESATHVLSVQPAPPPQQPGAVTVAGSLQSELGCSGDWQPECAATHLGFDAQDAVWQASFDVPAGAWEYKAPLDDNWSENYGQNATRNGANIGLTLAAPASVKFYYDHATHWITDNKNKVIATAPGSYQSYLGCGAAWDPACLRAWLQDPDGDGLYTFSTQALPAGDYEVKVAIDESWSENYGAGGVRNGANIAFNVPTSCAEVFFSYDPASHVLSVSAAGAPRGNLKKARAHWLAPDTLAWSVDAPSDGVFTLHYAPDAGLQLTAGGVENGIEIPLSVDPGGLSQELRARFPHLAGYQALKLDPARLAEVPVALRAQVAVSARDAQGRPLDATAVQLPGVLDALYTYAGALGVEWAGGVPTLRVWAPTARGVRLHLYPNPLPPTPPAVIPMTRDDATGVWSVTGQAGWRNMFYLYEVDVFVRATGGFETNLVSDPYSVSLSINSQRSQIVDLDDPALKPDGWDELAKPALQAPEDAALYELHVRDFSAGDPSVPQTWRGTFKAFTLAHSHGMTHLRRLAESGLSHVHLLPAFDIASVDENKSHWLTPGDLSAYAPDGTEQQAAVEAVRNGDAFNWGYDPWHYTVPEGSYSTDPNGAARILEFREMVRGLSDAGLRVVMDVVYNHTTASGQNARSVLDRVVPGYYHRLNAEGEVERSTCCENTASEHNMMEKLMIDSVLTWARAYKVDGFRFDLMGHHMKRNMVALRQALDALQLWRDGVDGPGIYVYGEGWNFGEVADNARGENAVQLNLAGTGIGTFSDRLRDAARGGGPFSPLREQGFLTGLYDDPNGTPQGSPAQQLERLLAFQDRLRLSLAGNLAGYSFEDRFGVTITGAQLDYFGLPAGYTADPQEVINYIEAHDNETFFDALQAKAAPSASLDERIRMQTLGNSLIAFAQGVPFFHAGQELLRSKSGDRNSYDSGDWFNRLDFTYASNNWGVGLPLRGENQSNWPIYAPLLADPALEPSSAQIVDALELFRETLLIRASQPLLRLRTAAEIEARVRFHDTGPGQTPGVIVMSVADLEGSLDRRVTQVAVVWNANKQARSVSVPAFVGRPFTLHPIQLISVDPVTRTSTFDPAGGTFNVPGRTAAFFWARRPLTEQIDLLAQDVEALRAAGVLSIGQAESLQAKLAAARRAVEDGRPSLAIAPLVAFQRQVGRLLDRGLLSLDQAYELIRQAQSIIEQLYV